MLLPVLKLQNLESSLNLKIWQVHLCKPGTPRFTITICQQEDFALDLNGDSYNNQCFGCNIQDMAKVPADINTAIGVPGFTSISAVPKNNRANS